MNVPQELEGKNSDISVLEASRLYTEYAKRFLILELEMRNEGFLKKRDKTIRANLNQPTISPEEYQSFKNFYNEYKYVLSKCRFDYSIFDKKSGRILPIKNIFYLKSLLKKLIDVNTKPNELENGEKIVGIPTKDQDYKKML